MDLKYFIEALDKIDPIKPLSGSAASPSAKADVGTQTADDAEDQVSDIFNKPMADLSAAEKQELTQQAAALQTFKSSAQNQSPIKNIAQALDKATAEKPLNPNDQKSLSPYMDVLASVAQDPKLSQTFKTLINQARMTQK